MDASIVFSFLLLTATYSVLCFTSSVLVSANSTVKVSYTIVYEGNVFHAIN